MKHILVPIDFSEDSINALEMSIQLANKLGYGIRLMHVIKNSSYYHQSLEITGLKDANNKKIIDNLKQIIEEFKEKIDKEIDYRIRKGKVYNEIANQAKYGEADMIVIGSHGTSGFEELWLGSNAYKVVNNSSCPVLSLRNSYKRHQINKIVVPIDDTPETRQKIPFTARIAKVFNAQMHILEISETKKENVLTRISQYSGQITKFLEDNDIDVVNDQVIGNNLTDITIEYALRNDADLISIMTEQSESTKNIWLGPYAQQMVNHSPLPVLSIQPY